MGKDAFTNYKYQIDVQFSHLLDTLFNVERLFDAEITKYKADLIERLNKVPEAERTAYLEDYSSDLWFIETLVPSKIRTSILISCYSTFEYELLQVCKTIGNKNLFPITLNDLKGKGVFLAQAYLEKVAQVSIPDKDVALPHIIAFNTVRNMIVHNNERFDRNHPKAVYITQYIASEKESAGDIVIDEKGYFEISYNYAYFIIHLMQGWFQKLFEDPRIIELFKNKQQELKP